MTYPFMTNIMYIHCSRSETSNFIGCSRTERLCLTSTPLYQYDVWVNKSFIEFLKYSGKGFTQELIAFIPPHCYKGVVSLKKSGTICSVHS